MYRRDYYNDCGYERDDIPRPNPREEFDREFGFDEGYYTAWCCPCKRETEHDPSSGCVPCGNEGQG